MIFRAVGDSKPYPDHGLSQSQWGEIAPTQIRLDQLVTTKRMLDLDVLMAEDSTYFGDLFAHVVEWQGVLYLEDGLHRALRAALQQRHVLHARVLQLADWVRIPPIPGPQAVLGGAVAAAEAVETAIGLVPRMVTAISRIEVLLDRVEALVTRIESVAAAADEATARTYATIDRADQVTSVAAAQAESAQVVLDRIDTSLNTWEPTLERMAPAARRFGESLSEQEVDAAIALVDRMPKVLEHLDQDVIPVLTTLDRVGPDVHELLDVVQDLRRVITGLPGVNLLRRRGDDDPPDH